MRLQSETQEEATKTSPKPKKFKELGLLTFDLDDTLYAIAPVVEAANGKLFSNLYLYLFVYLHARMERCLKSVNQSLTN